MKVVQGFQSLFIQFGQSLQSFSAISQPRLRPHLQHGIQERVVRFGGESVDLPLSGVKIAL